MSGEAVAIERARLFVALELPAAVREVLVSWRAAALGAASGLRLIGPEDLHVTLCFLGWRDAGEAASIVRACATAAGERPAALQLGRAIWLPPRRPRVLAVEVEDATGALAGTQAALSRVLEAGGWYVPEKRRFLAHVTVARVLKNARPAHKGPLAPPRAVAFEGSRVTVYRSRLAAGGARYEALGSVTLAG